MATLLAVALGNLTADGARADGARADDDRRQRSAYTLAVLGDYPYSAAQAAAFAAAVDQVNADPEVRLVAHLGDIKSGSTRCDDSYFASIRAQFDRFADPLVYTPGDNEWTDCHRPNNGAYDPLERLAAIRAIFVPVPGRTVGQRPARVRSQVGDGVPENVRWSKAGVELAAVHVVGSNNALAPRTGLTEPTSEQSLEVATRTRAAVELIEATFDAAREDRPVVIMMQADMFDPSVPQPTLAANSAFVPIVRVLAERAAKHDGPVYLLNGDSHVYTENQPLRTGSPWLAFYGVPTAADNLTRITVEGSATGNEYLRLRVGRGDSRTLTWARVPLT